MKWSKFLQLAFNFLVLEFVGLTNAQDKNAVDVTAELRSQFRTLAPLISMDRALVLTEVSDTVMVGKFEQAVSLLKSEFDSHPTLREVAFRHIHYLLESETHNDPVLNATEPATAELMMETFSRLMQDRVLRAWQLELDQRCRRSYETLMPLVVKLAGAIRQPRQGEFSCHYKQGRILLSGTEGYSNCSLEVRYIGVGGESATAFFFVPTLSNQTEVELRVPVDFESGPEGVGEVKVKLFCDEAHIAGLSFTLDENLENAVRNKLIDLRSLCHNNPFECVEQTKKLATVTAAVPYQNEIIRIQGAARKFAQQKLLILQNQLVREKEHFSQLRRLISRAVPDGLGEYDQGLASQASRIEQLEDEILQLRRVR